MEGMLDARLRDVVTRVGHYDWLVTEFVRVTDTTLPNRCFRRVAPELKHAARTPAGPAARSSSDDTTERRRRAAAAEPRPWRARWRQLDAASATQAEGQGVAH
jgi:tRNA-dihydrouridine synthase C